MNYLIHYGTPGQKWGVRNYQNPDGTWTELGKERRRKDSFDYSIEDIYDEVTPWYAREGDTFYGKPPNVKTEEGRSVFVSGSSKTQTEDSGYYRKKLPMQVRTFLDNCMATESKVLVGDAPGIDRQVQDYLKKNNYMNVRVYGTEELRYLADDKWDTKVINPDGLEKGSKEYLEKKDIAMTEDATEGLAVILDQGAKATRKNVERLLDNFKDVKTVELSKRGKWFDKYSDFEEIVNAKRFNACLDQNTSKKERAEAQKKYLEYGAYNTLNGIISWGNIQGLISDKCGLWDGLEGVKSTRLKNLLIEKRSTNSPSETAAIDKQIAREVLEEIGFDVNSKNIELMKWWI